ncbi:hypothetical protein ACFT2C_09010 [Promicromonospora sp. NPDC057138]|uniref:hypothetical protein n=1 Tax=Promicromonospora sp. NPDC057138 TaxID=3346031 RepID=UPI003624FFEF
MPIGLEGSRTLADIGEYARQGTLQEMLMTRTNRATAAAVRGLLAPILMVGALAACTGVPAHDPSVSSSGPTSNSGGPSPTVDPLRETEERGEQLASTLVDALEGAERTATDDITSKIFDGPGGPEWEWKGVFVLSARSEMNAEEAAKSMRDRLMAEGDWTVRQTTHEEADDLTFYDFRSSSVDDDVALPEWWVQITASTAKAAGDQYIRAYIYAPTVYGSE